MAKFPFDEFVSHIVTMYDVQADSILDLYLKIAKYLNDNPIVSEKTVGEIISKYLEENPVQGDFYGPNNPPPYPVTSVNGKTGDIEIETTDSNAYSPSNPPPYPVKSVNGRTGEVTVTMDNSFLKDSGTYRQGASSGSYPMYTVEEKIDFLTSRGYIGAQYGGLIAETDVCIVPTTKQTYRSSSSATSQYTAGLRHGIRFKSGELEEVVFKKSTGYSGSNANGINVNQIEVKEKGKIFSEINPPPYPVTSVNGKTGDVVIDAGGSADAYTPTNPPPYPVRSVNGKTGDVVIDANIGVLDATLYPDEDNANMSYVIPSPVTKNNLISMVWQGWTKSSYPGYHSFSFKEQWGNFVFDIIQYGYNYEISDNGLFVPSIYNDSADKGVKVRFYYKL